jgi:hypothetical protein
VRGTWGRLSWRGTIVAAFVVTLTRPLSWALGLAGFLAGGGIVVVAWPILVLPTVSGLQNVLGGPVTSLAFGVPSDMLLALIAGLIAGSVAIALAGLIAGAWAERQGIVLALEAAADDGLVPSPDLEGAPGTGRVALLRLLSLVPVGVTAALAWRPVYDATYHELILPGDLATPLPVRVASTAPWPLLALLVTWLLSDAAAAVGVRRLVLERRPVLVAWALGWADLVRRPLRVVGVAVIGGVLLTLVVLPAMIAAGIGWGRVRAILVDGGEPVLALGAIVLWVTIWLGGLVLAGVAASVRSAAWTLELPRRAAGVGPSPG